MGKDPDIALVVLDTLRKDYFEEEFEWLHSTGTYFDNGWSTSHWTIPAHASLFSGRYACEIGTGAKNRRLTVKKTLGELLSNAGYRTMAITANPTVSPEFNYNSGFDRFDSLFSRSWKQYVNPGLPSPLKYLFFVTRSLQSDSSLETLRSAYEHKIKFDEVDLANGAKQAHTRFPQTDKEPTFLFVNLMEVHSPYKPPQGYRTGPAARLTATQALLKDGPEQDGDRIINAYSDSVSYLSDVYNEIHSDLCRDYDLVITISDHGEALGEGDYWGHPPVLTPEITRVPIHIAGTNENKTVSTPVNLLDVFQTICDAAETSIPSNSHGTSLFNSHAGSRSLLVESSGMTERALEIAKNLDVPEKEVARLDNPRYGLVTDSGYAFETIAGDLYTIGSIDNAQNRLETKLDKIEMVDAEESSSPSKELLDHLQDLGYA